MKKFGFWIIPENYFHQELEKMIVVCSQKYGSPIFVPHVSIFGSVVSTDEQVVKKVQQVAGKIKPFEVSIGDVEFSTTYFQCLFVRVKTNAHLLKTHLSLKETFHIGGDIVYMPHASILYGNFDMDAREKIAPEIHFKNTQFTANKISIIRRDSDD